MANLVQKYQSINPQTRTATLSLVVAITLYIADFFVWKFNGLDMAAFVQTFFVFWQLAWRTLLSVSVAVVILVYLLNKGDTKREDLFIYSFFGFMVSVIFLFGGPSTLPHLVIGALIVFGVVDPQQTTAQKLSVLMGLYFIDFFGFGLVTMFAKHAIVGNRLVMPIWVWYSLWKNYQYTGNAIYMSLIIVVVFMYVLSFMDGTVIWHETQVLGMEEYRGLMGFISDVGKNAKNLFDEFMRSINPIPYTNNGQPTEITQYIYLKGDSEEYIYAIGDPVTVVATLERSKLQTAPPPDDEDASSYNPNKQLTSPITVVMKCWAEASNGILINGRIDGEQEKSVNINSPGDMISVECSFMDDYSLPSKGRYNIFFLGEFPFYTVSQQLVYFVDSDERSKLILDKGSPEDALYTKYGARVSGNEVSPGPVALSLTLDEKAFWGVYRDDQRNQNIKVQISSAWEKGEIKELEGLYLYLPPGLSFVTTTCQNNDNSPITNYYPSASVYKVTGLAKTLDDNYVANCRVTTTGYDINEHGFKVTIAAVAKYVYMFKTEVATVRIEELEEIV